ncbi:hypothetical protein CCACVL1_18436 [Corchorus capsularis]|uniref:Uncharacterized protein n=1 Tax=Corchorus capsularis TaxID=210143 RepID=A0A1R3HLF1_COCAP|nr:hypothetical protein CCACVL1_21640 [Corchorus capsularis]OMO71118.1 hypothetical protein CCACVL1_18436 [Corchorus capsularis]
MAAQQPRPKKASTKSKMLDINKKAQ